MVLFFHFRPNVLIRKVGLLSIWVSYSLDFPSQIKYLEDQNRRLEESISLAEDENFKQTKVASLNCLIASMKFFLHCSVLRIKTNSLNTLF